MVIPDNLNPHLKVVMSLIKLENNRQQHNIVTFALIK